MILFDKKVSLDILACPVYPVLTPHVQVSWAPLPSVPYPSSSSYILLAAAGAIIIAAVAGRGTRRDWRAFTL